MGAAAVDAQHCDRLAPAREPREPGRRSQYMHAEVKGTTLPHLEMILDQGEYVISTHGELSWMTPNIMLSQTTGGSNQPGGGGGFMGALKRAVGGGSIFLTRYESTG